MVIIRLRERKEAGRGPPTYPNKGTPIGKTDLTPGTCSTQLRRRPPGPPPPASSHSNGRAGPDTAQIATFGSAPKGTPAKPRTSIPKPLRRHPYPESKTDSRLVQTVTSAADILVVTRRQPAPHHRVPSPQNAERSSHASGTLSRSDRSNGNEAIKTVHSEQRRQDNHHRHSHDGNRHAPGPHRAPGLRKQSRLSR